MPHRVLILVWSLCCWGALAVNRNPEPYSLRLVGGESRCQGELHVQRTGQDWTAVDPRYFSLRFGQRACAELDCGSALTVKRKTVSNREAVFFSPNACEDAELIHCFSPKTQSTDWALELSCSDSVRLVSGRSLCSGTLQIRDQSLNQSWTPVCEGALKHRGAEVLCRELGCGAPLLQGAVSPLGQTFYCEGHESALMDCPRTQTRTNPETCSGSALHLTCSEPVRLVGGASRCEGTLEVKYGGEWSRALTFSPLVLEAADAVCQSLDCGSAVSVEERRGLSRGDAWGVTSDCVTKAAVRDCVFAGFSDHDVALEMVCSELLNIPVVSVSGGSCACSDRVMMGADFQVKCSVEAQYPGGSFQLLSPTLNLTLPAVNHSAHFLFTDAGPAHKGDYTCVYHLQVFNHKFSSNSSLHINPGGAVAVNRNSTEPYSLRLFGGDSRCRGELMVQIGKNWTTVSPMNISLQFGHRLCAELNCGSALTVTRTTVFKRLVVLLWPDACEDTSLINCFSSDKSASAYSLELACSEPLIVEENLKDTMRLVGGASHCEGTMEVKYKGEWKRAWPAEPWDLEAGAAVCQALDCGSAVSTEQRREFTRTDVWRIGSNCVKTISAVKDCVLDGFSGSDAGVELVCSDSVRLVSGRSLCSGSLQIRDQSLNQSWTWVCEGALGRRGAEVLCRELGCGAPLLLGALSPRRQTFHCEGHESALMDCPRTKTRADPGTCSRLHLTCSEPVKLVGGPSRCEGTVRVRHRGEWRRVMASILNTHWDLEAAAAVCRDLDCGSALSTEDRRDLRKNDVWAVRPLCVKTASVRDCIFSGRSEYEGGLKVVCSDSVRLVSGRGLCSGSLQIRDQSLNQSWTPVCEGALDHRGAEVLCRELGCGAPLLKGALSTLGQTFHCKGHESALMDCPRTQTRTDPGTCSGRTLNLTCSEPVRLVGGANGCEGTVELKYRAEWRRTMTFYETYSVRDPYDLEFGVTVCRSLDCGSAVSAKRSGFDFLNMNMEWGVNGECVKTAGAVRGCVFGGFNGLGSGLEVVCSDSVRLVSGRSLCSGSLQIRDQSLNQSWTPVCDGALDRRGAEVLCRELDCGAPLLQGALSPLGQTFHCEGHESALMDCPQTQTRTDPGTCSGSALQLTCSEPVRLVGGASRCEGTLELKYRGEWRQVKTFPDPWDMEVAAVVCRGLDCGSAVSMRRSLNKRNVWGVDSDCVKKKAAVRDCVWEGPSSVDGGERVVCSDLLTSPVVSVSEGVYAPWEQGGVQVPMGADFRLTCSVEPQYPGGSFQLLSPTLNLAVPAVNHSAHFLFTDAGPAHRGVYTCVYLLKVFEHHFSSNSSLHISPQNQTKVQT